MLPSRGPGLLSEGPHLGPLGPGLGLGSPLLGRLPLAGSAPRNVGLKGPIFLCEVPFVISAGLACPTLTVAVRAPSAWHL